MKNKPLNDLIKAEDVCEAFSNSLLSTSSNDLCIDYVKNNSIVLVW